MSLGSFKPLLIICSFEPLVPMFMETFTADPLFALEGEGSPAVTKPELGLFTKVTHEDGLSVPGCTPIAGARTVDTS